MWAAALIVTGIFEAVVITIGVRTRGNARGAAFGLAAACGYALTATLMKSAVAALSQGIGAVLQPWQLYATAVVGVGALWLLQNGLQAGSLVAVQPPLTLGDALISAAYGVTVFGENVQTGGWLLVVQIVAVIAVAIGCIELSRSLAMVHVPQHAELAGEPAPDHRAGDGWPGGRLGQRVVIFRYAVPAGDPVRRCCPACRTSCCHPHHDPGCFPLPAGAQPAVSAPDRPRLTVEATSAILLGALAARIHPGLVLAAACWLAVCAVPLAFVDAAVRRRPDALTAPAYAGTAVFLLLAATTSGHWQDLVRAALGGIALAAFYLALALISPAGMGLAMSRPRRAWGPCWPGSAGASWSRAAWRGCCWPPSTASRCW